jgi:signal transduction histidine kinase
MGIIAIGRAGTNQPLARIMRVRVAGHVFYGDGITNLLRGGKLRLPAFERVEFTFLPVDEAKDQPLRLRRTLAGVEPDWREAGGEMLVLVLAYDESGHILSYTSFNMVGESEGWRGAVEKSEFYQRRESLTLPAGAERLEVLLIAADWNVLGTAAITDFRVFRQDTTGKAQNIWPDPKVEEGTNLDSPEGQPRYWTRGSLGKSMARVLKLPPPAQGHALVIADNDIHISPNWQADLPLGRKARTGETLTVEWREAFSVGTGGRKLAMFDSLSPGDYVFRVKTVTPSGEPIGGEAALAISIPQVIWKRPAVIALGLAAFGLAGAAMVRTATRRRLQAQLDEVERRRRIERERLRIAQDIHDDLGASLTHISLISQTAHEKIEKLHPAWVDTERLRALTTNLTRKLDEIVWAISPRHDTIESLLSYLTDLAEEFLGAAGIPTRIHFPDELPSWTLPPGLRHNVFLATKESLNNIVKHANATEVHLRLVILPGAFQLTVEDNGDGYSMLPPLPPAATRPVHHGLEGIQERIESLGGKCSIDSAPGGGTRVVLTVPVNAVEP